jgi:hypothetical protein
MVGGEAANHPLPHLNAMKTPSLRALRSNLNFQPDNNNYFYI